ncbi:MAG: c-type cytochrome [Bacteroidales bacterium]|nr:c-type cytochrome [Bacteroidales bacterium]MBN2755894.1 c-type cytochrome [Bacteroidales bacterium]
MEILKKMKFLFLSLLFVFGGLILQSSTNDTQDEWPVPAEFKNMKNPMAGKADAKKVGKTLFDQHCASCHGAEGYGDGKKASQLDTEMRDLTSKEVLAQTDGELYYKSFIGRDEMPNFEKKITSVDDRWFIVNYMRTLK